MSKLTKMIKNKLTITECVPYLRKGFAIRNPDFYSKDFFWKAQTNKYGHDFYIVTSNEDKIEIESRDLTRNDYEVWDIGGNK